MHAFHRQRSKGQSLAELTLVCPFLLMLFASYVSFAKGFIIRAQARSAARFTAYAGAIYFEAPPGLTNAPNMPGTAMEKGFFFKKSSGGQQTPPKAALYANKPTASGSCSQTAGNDPVFGSLLSVVCTVLSAAGSISSVVTDLFVSSSYGRSCQGYVSGVRIAPSTRLLTGFGTTTDFNMRFYVMAGTYTRNHTGKGILAFIPLIGSSMPQINIPGLGSIP